MYQIRRVNSWEDVAVLASTPGVHPPLPSAVEWMASDHVALVALGPDGPVGAILLRPDRQLGTLTVKYRLNWLMVLPEHRNRGVGRQLAKSAAAEAATRGAHAIQIPLKPENQQCLIWSESLPKVPGVGFVVSLDRCEGF